MNKFFALLGAIVLLMVGCTDDVITQVSLRQHYRPATEAEAISAGCANPETAMTVVDYVDYNYNGILDTSLEEESSTIAAVLCGGADGRDGEDGQDGFSLVASVEADGNCFNVTLYTDIDRSQTVTVGDIPLVSFPVCNGEDGQDGADGVNGSNGADAPFLLVQSSRISPLEQELVFYLDLDGSFDLSEGDTVVDRIVVRDGEQGPQGIQGPQGERGPAGIDGTNGFNGTDGLDAVAPPTLTVHIEAINGVTYFVFYYDLNENGEFDETDEIASTGSIADGQDGQNGLDGATGDTGPAGQDGLSWLFTSADVVADPYCSGEDNISVPYTGTDEAARITFISWVDTDNGIQSKWRIRNGLDVAITNVTAQVGGNPAMFESDVIPANTEIFILRDDSYNGVSLKWDGGSKGTASSGNKPESADAACEGGLFLFGGLDVDRDGILDEDEVSLSQLIPAGADGEDGVDFVGSTTEYVDPLPGVPAVMGNHKELIMKVTDIEGNVRYFGVYFDHGKKRTFLSELFPGVTYATTDGRSGTFKVDNL